MKLTTSELRAAIRHNANSVVNALGKYLVNNKNTAEDVMVSAKRMALLAKELAKRPDTE